MKKNQKKLIAFATALTLIGSVSGQLPGEYINIISDSVYAEKDVKFEVKDPYNDDSATVYKQKLTLHKSADETETIEIVDDAVYTFSNGKLTIKAKNSKDDKCTACCAYNRLIGKELVTSIEVGEGIKYLGNDCFHGFDNVKSVSLPSTLEVIGEYAFNGMKSLESLTIPDSVIEIDYAALSYLPKIEEIIIPSNVQYLGEELITYNDSLKKVEINGTGASAGHHIIAFNENLEEIYFGSGINFTRYRTVDLCKNLKKLTIASSDTSIVDNAFSALSSSNVIDLSLPDSFNSIERYAFQSMKAEKIIIPETKTIGEFAFESCKTDDLSINGAEKIGEHAFQNVKVSDLFSIKNVKEIGEYCFAYTEIKDVDLSSCNGISIGDYAFNGSNKLEHLTLPSSLGTIGNNAFSNCTSLETINYSKGISDFKEIPYCMFSGCSSLKSFYDTTTFKPAVDTRKNTVIIPSGVETIGEQAFSGCKAIENIKLPDNLKTIKKSAFSGNENISEIEIPSGTKSIGENAFGGCTKLTGITIPKSVTEIGDKAFDKCTSLTIYGYTGSYAETYANKNNIPFVDLTKKTDTTTTETTVTEVTATTAATTTASSDTSKAETTAADTAASSNTSKAETTAASTTASSNTSKAETTAASTTASSNTSKAETTATTKALSTTASDSQELIYGDLNGDGVADLTDLTILGVYLMSKNDAKNIKNVMAGDVDGNGVVDIADLPKFKQYISKDSSVPFLGPNK